ncbi:MAG: XdhC/CoxI family protein [Tepidisphaeraceae bacterium]
MLKQIEQILLSLGHGDAAALCAIVRTRGSTPQSAGAAMVVLQNGQTFGTLGGGCVEAEVRRRALELIERRQSRLANFKLDHDYGWDDGLVCGGVMDVAIQVMDSPQHAEHLRQVRDQLAARQEARIQISVNDEAGQEASFQIPLFPTPTLLIAGAGHVAMALARIAPDMDFHVTVIDDRPDFATPARFTNAQCIVGEIEQELSRYPIDGQTYVVIVTRGHRRDGHALAAVVNKPARYIGLIGSKRKIHTILGDLHENGVTRERLAAVHAPIGLEIGAVTPGEIALSIAAELIAVRRGRGDQPAAPMKVAAEQLDRWLDKRRPDKQK